MNVQYELRKVHSQLRRLAGVYLDLGVGDGPELMAMAHRIGVVIDNLAINAANKITPRPYQPLNNQPLAVTIGHPDWDERCHYAANH
jgi:hypothetical protein